MLILAITTLLANFVVFASLSDSSLPLVITPQVQVTVIR